MPATHSIGIRIRRLEFNSIRYVEMPIEKHLIRDCQSNQITQDSSKDNIQVVERYWMSVSNALCLVLWSIFLWALARDTTSMSFEHPHSVLLSQSSIQLLACCQFEMVFSCCQNTNSSTTARPSHHHCHFTIASTYFRAFQVYTNSHTPLSIQYNPAINFKKTKVLPPL